MAQEEPSTPLDGEKAYDVWKSVLGGYVGKFSRNERFGGEEFKGKGWKGEFVIHFRFYGPYASVGADINNYGQSCPCETLELVKSETEQCAELCGARPRQPNDELFKQVEEWLVKKCARLRKYQDGEIETFCPPMSIYLDCSYVSKQKPGWLHVCTWDELGDPTPQWEYEFESYDKTCKLHYSAHFKDLDDLAMQYEKKVECVFCFYLCNEPRYEQLKLW